LDVTIVNNGTEAISKAESETFDMILMDVHMPNMNGFKATKVLRKRGIETPIVALTANVMTGDRQKCIDAGCTDYISKPIDRLKLAEVFAKYLRSKQVTNSSRS